MSPGDIEMHEKPKFCISQGSKFYFSSKCSITTKYEPLVKITVLFIGLNESIRLAWMDAVK